MPQQNVNLDEFLIGQWLSRIARGESVPSVPGIAFNGQVTDPAAAVAALKSSQWGQQKLSDIQAGIGFETPTQINGNTLSFGREDNNDLIAPASMLLSYGVGGALSGGFSGIGNGVSGGVGGATGAFGNGPMFDDNWILNNLASNGADPSWGVNPEGNIYGDGTPYNPGIDEAANPGQGNFNTIGTPQWYQMENLLRGTPLPELGSGIGDLLKKLGPTAAKTLLGGGAGAAAGSSGLAGLFGADGSINPNALMNLLGRAAPGVLGAVASNQQTDLLKQLAEQQRADEQARYADLKARDTERFQTLMGREDAAIARQRGDIEFGRAVGAPSRERYESSYAPGFTMSNDPGFTDALNLAGKSAMHGMSVNGNPAGSPNAWEAVQSDLFSKYAYPALKDYRTLNATTGGYSGYNAAGATVPGIGTNLPASTSAGSNVGTQAGSSNFGNAIGAQGNIWNSLGAAAGNVFNPPKSLPEQLQEFKTLSGAF